MVKKPSRKTLKLKAWKSFSKYIRIKYSDENGNCKCVTCGKTGFWKDMQAGHAIGGRTNSILFHEKIVHIQCKQCNIFKSGNYIHYTLFMIDTYGREEFNHLLALKNKELRITLYELINICDEYKAKTERLTNYNAQLHDEA